MLAVVCLALAGALALLGAVLLLHHGYAHMNDDPYTSLAKLEGAPAACCFFQLRDVSNHETWIIVAWTNAITLSVVGVCSLLS